MSRFWPDYSLTTRVTTVCRRAAPAVVTLFIYARNILNAKRLTTVVKTRRVVTPVVTRKPAEIRRFRATGLLTTSLATQKKNREKRWAGEGIAREASSGSHATPAPNPNTHHQEG